LHYAAEFGNIDIAKLILIRGDPGIVDLEDNKGETVFIIPFPSHHCLDSQFHQALEIAIQNGHEVILPYEDNRS
jgi:ankyrin repeat protein